MHQCGNCVNMYGAGAAGVYQCGDMRMLCGVEIDKHIEGRGL